MQKFLGALRAAFFFYFLFVVMSFFADWTILKFQPVGLSQDYVASGHDGLHLKHNDSINYLYSCIVKLSLFLSIKPSPFSWSCSHTHNYEEFLMEHLGHGQRYEEILAFLWICPCKTSMLNSGSLEISLCGDNLWIMLRSNIISNSNSVICILV